MSLFPIISPSYPGVPSSLPVTANLVSWWRADLGITLNGADVSGWDDQQGSVDWAQSTALDQPLYVADATNGRPGIQFDGTDHWLQATFASQASPFHLWFVLKSISWTNADAILRQAPSLRQSGSSPQYAHSNGSPLANQTTTAPSLGTFHLLQAYYVNSTSSYLAINNDSHVTGGNPGSGGFLASATALAAENDGSQAANISICEFAYFNALKSGSDETSLKNYFNETYALWS